jgi:hypothetical protein
MAYTLTLPQLMTKKTLQNLSDKKQETWNGDVLEGRP